MGRRPLHRPFSEDGTGWITFRRGCQSAQRSRPAKFGIGDVVGNDPGDLLGMRRDHEMRRSSERGQ
jgi:hypothetical protein